MRRIFSKFLVVCAFGVWGGAPVPVHSAERLRDQLVATVYDTPILMSDVLKRIKLMLAMTSTPFSREAASRLFDDILRSLMAEKFKCFLASQNGVKISDAQVNQAVEKISKANKVKVSFFKDLCRKAGVPYETFLDQIAAEKLWESYIIQKYRSQIVVSPSDLAAYRESIKVLEQMPSYQLIEIILDASGKLSPEVLQARFQNMVTALQEGMPLDVAVAQFSDGPLRGQKGYLGWVSEADLPREARSFLRQQGASSFSPPIKTPHGNVTYFLMTPPQRGEKLSEEEARQRLFIMRLDRYAKRELDPLQREPVGKISMGKVEFLKNLS